ncbi:hypothetical protein GPX89_33310 [Nocardia sp. ET3-3]|uniref:histidine kinase n=1 Tax=Nocardia terrae TaxID=2675851 RepID=A0A7K1V642_9NOCA|nr:hypothetical protein [Nocardia terrae]
MRTAESGLRANPGGSGIPGGAVRSAAAEGAGTSATGDIGSAAGALDRGENPGGGGILGGDVDSGILGGNRDSAVGGAGAVVEVELVREGATLHIAVADSGAGVAPELVDSVFAEGVSTKSGGGAGGRGLGLALSRQVARARGGEVRLADPGGAAVDSPDPAVGDTGTVLRGAEFIARMPGVLSEEEPAWAEEI